MPVLAKLTQQADIVLDIALSAGVIRRARTGVLVHVLKTYGISEP